MNIEIYLMAEISDETNFYGVSVNGSVILECLAEDEIQELTVSDINNIATKSGIL